MRWWRASGRTASVAALCLALAQVTPAVASANPQPIAPAAEQAVQQVLAAAETPVPATPSEAEIARAVDPGEATTVGVAAVDAATGEFEVRTIEAVGPEQVGEVVRDVAAQPATVAVGLPQAVQSAEASPVVPAQADAGAAAGLDFYRPTTTARPWPYNQYALDLLCADPTARANPHYSCTGEAMALATGKGQVVAVVDAGVDTSHPDLAASTLPGGKCLNVGNQPCLKVGATNPADYSEHGTHVAGIVAAVAGNGIGIAGLAPEAKVLPVQVLAKDGSGWSTDVAAGVTWAVDNGATVINLSLATKAGAGSDPVLAAAVANAIRLGVVVVAAAGNSGPTDNFLAYPAAYPGVLGVGSITADRVLDDSSARGDWVDLTAPGFMVVSTLPGERYGYYSGTSMATPHVAAAAALLRQHFPQMRGAGVAGRLMDTADDEGPPGRDAGFGAGIVNPLAALNLSGASAPVMVGLGFVPIAPARVLDTRFSGPIGPHQTRTAKVSSEVGTGRTVIPPDAVAIAYNLTVADPAAAGHLRVMPGDVSASPTSAINFAARETIANGSVVAIDDADQIRVFNAAGAAVNAVVDVLGYFTAPGQAGSSAGGFTPIAPLRVYDAAASQTGLLAPGETRLVSVAADPDAVVAVPEGATAVAYNLTVVEPTSPGHLRVMPGDATTTAASAINWTRAGDKVANGLVVAIPAQRTIRVFNGSSAPVRFLVDVAGYYRPGDGALFHPIAPARAYDSRQASPAPGSLAPGDARTVYLGDGRDAFGNVIAVDVVPDEAVAVAYNVTVPPAPGNGGGHLRLWPAQHPLPGASVLNWAAGGGTRANGALVGISDSREIGVHNGSAEANHVIVDVLGYYA